MKEKIRVLKTSTKVQRAWEVSFFCQSQLLVCIIAKGTTDPSAVEYFCSESSWTGVSRGSNFFYQVPYSALAGGNITFWGHVYSALLASSGTFSRLFCLGSDCLRFKGLISGMELNLSIHICRFICINEITVYFKWIAEGQFTFCTCCQIFGDTPATQLANIVIRTLIQMQKSD